MPTRRYRLCDCLFDWCHIADDDVRSLVPFHPSLPRDGVLHAGEEDLSVLDDGAEGVAHTLFQEFGIDNRFQLLEPSVEGLKGQSAFRAPKLRSHFRDARERPPVVPDVAAAVDADTAPARPAVERGEAILSIVVLPLRRFPILILMHFHVFGEIVWISGEKVAGIVFLLELLLSEVLSNREEGEWLLPLVFRGGGEERLIAVDVACEDGFEGFHTFLFSMRLRISFTALL